MDTVVLKRHFKENKKAFKIKNNDTEQENYFFRTVHFS
jgi:uncharacterized protein YjbK